MSDVTAPYAPKLTYLCDDLDCCWNGCPSAVCSVCRKEWPCPDFVAAHTEGQVKAQIRWMERKWHEVGIPEWWLTYFVDLKYEALVTVRAHDLEAGEVIMLGGLMLTRLRTNGPLTRTAKMQKSRFVNGLRLPTQGETK